MPRRSIRRPELQAHQRELARSIDQALSAGQRGDGTLARFWSPWTNTGFAYAAKVSERSVANWRNADALMPPEDIQPLLKAFYGNIERFTDDRATMQRQWQLARGYVFADEVSGTEWEPGKSPNLQGSVHLVTLNAHPPVLWNDGTLRLSITLVISPDRDLSYRGRAITVGLAEALLRLEPGLYQPSYKAQPSQRGNSNFKISADGERIVGPVDKVTGMIDGEPLGDDHFVTLEPAEGGTGPIVITVHAAKNSFRILPKGSTNQNLIINALFYEQLRDQDDHNRAVLARVTLGLRQ